MRQQSCFREFFRYMAFSVLGTLGVSCYILADTYFVSKGMGTNGIAALNLAIPVYNFIYGVGIMLGMGGATKFSLCKSQGRQKESDQVYTHTIYLAAFFSAFFVLLGLFCPNRLAALLGADSDTLQMTTTYLRWLLLFAPAFILNNVLLCFVRNDDDPQLAMMAMVTGSLANILLDYIFIFPMELGIFGAVFASGLSPIISIVIMLPHWIPKKNTFHFVKTRLRAGVVKQELSLGFPSLVTQLSTGIVMIVFNGIILRLKGNTGVAAYGVIANISLVVAAVYNGIAQGVQPLISRYYGVSSRKQVQTLLRYAMATMLFISGAVYLALFIYAQPVAAIFNSERNPELQQIAVEGIKLYFLSNVFVGFNIILATYFTSVDYALPAHILSVIRGFFLIIPMAFLLSALWGMTGVWLAYPLTEMLAAVLGCVLYLRSKKSGT